MAAKSNQDIEKHYFEKFQKVHHLPEGEIIYGDMPDVVIKGSRKIGIEITNFYFKSGSRPDSEQIQRKERDLVVSKAQEHYLFSNGSNIDIVFSFNLDVPIIKTNRHKLAKQIALLAKQIEGLNTGGISKDLFANIPELFLVYLIEASEEYKNPKWRVNQGYSVEPMDIKRLQEIVEQKESRLPNYRPCDAYWLLVVVNFMDTAQDQAIQAHDEIDITFTDFEKVIVFGTEFSKVRELKNPGAVLGAIS